jgi:hypothetical protein
MKNIIYDVERVRNINFKIMVDITTPEGKQRPQRAPPDPPEL